MPRFLDTRGRSPISLRVCARCWQKFPYADVFEDPNSPGLFVCKDDLDVLDPYRLPAREVENVQIDNPRPDVSLTGERPTPLFGQEQLDPISGGAHVISSPVTALGPKRTWQPNTFYRKGDTITPQNVDDQNVDLPQRWFVCLIDGWSGETPPNWPEEVGVLFQEPRS